MRQKEIEKKQREILFNHFKAGTLKRKMDAAYGEEETAETAKPAEPVEAAETTESAKPAKSAKSAKSAKPAETAKPYDYEFDFKYLLGNYCKAYRGDGYYNNKKAGCAEVKELEKETEDDPILLWYIYRKIDNKNDEENDEENDEKNDENEKNVRLFDCDSWNGSNDLMDEIYDRLWRNKMDKSLRDKFGGDTMNSFATTFHALFCKKSDKRSFLAYKEDIKSIESEESEEKKKFYDALREYAKLTGCLGNFVLVPKGFNGYRGLAGTIRDYWDLSLHELRCDRSGQGWLDLVDMPFNKYINLFFLWDYVSEKKNGGYRARPLFKRHEAILTREKIVLPRKADREGASDDFSEFTKNANRCILRRGAFMSTMLRISVEYSDSYDKIVDYLATDASLGSMEDVIEQLQLKALPSDEKAKGFLSKLSEELKKIDHPSETGIHEKN